MDSVFGYKTTIPCIPLMDSERIVLMWFKNMLVYRLPQDFLITSEVLNEALSSQLFTPCKTHEALQVGWTSPANNNHEELVYSSNRFMMVCMKSQEKLLPASVVNEQLQERIELLSEKEARKASRKERLNLKEDIIHELLPRAFTRTKLLHAYFDVTHKWLVINTASATKAEAMINLLRKCLGSFPVIPLTSKNLPRAIITDWLKNNPPQSFTLGGECEFTDNEEKTSKINCKGQNLFTDEIQSHLNAGMSVTQLSIEWDERIHCIINEKLAIKRIKMSDLIQEKAQSADDKNEQFDIDFALMTLEFSEFLTALTHAMQCE